VKEKQTENRKSTDNVKLHSGQLQFKCKQYTNLTNIAYLNVS